MSTAVAAGQMGREQVFIAQTQTQSCRDQDELSDLAAQTKDTAQSKCSYTCLTQKSPLPAAKCFVQSSHPHKMLAREGQGRTCWWQGNASRSLSRPPPSPSAAHRICGAGCRTTCSQSMGTTGFPSPPQDRYMFSTDCPGGKGRENGQSR